MAKAIDRAFTPGGGEDPAAVTARQEGAERKAMDAAKASMAAPPTPPTMPAPPAPPPMFSAGAAQGARQRAAVSASTVLGAAATGGQQAKKTLLGA